MAGWYDERSLAYGSASDVRACARIFADVHVAMDRARPRTIAFTNSGSDVWGGTTAEGVRDEMDGIPELMRRFSVANNTVATTLNRFAPQLDDYQQLRRTLQSNGRSKAYEIAQVERRREQRLDELRDQGVDVIGWVTGYSGDAQVNSLNVRLEQLYDDLGTLRRRFDANGESFEDAVYRAADLIWDADSVLYNNGWDKFWSQDLKPILDVVRVVLEIAAVIVTIAAIIGSGGTLLPLILAGMLLAVSATQVIGTAAAGREVTREMWVNLVLDTAAVVTLGAAHHARKVKLAADASKAAKLTKGKTVVRQSTRLKHVDDAVDGAQWWARRAELVEGGLVAGEGGYRFFVEGDWTGLIEMGAGGLDVGGVGGAAGDVAKAGHDAVGAADGIAELADSPKMDDRIDGLVETPVGNDTDKFEAGAPAPEPSSPSEWPGLEAFGTPQ